MPARSSARRGSTSPTALLPRKVAFDWGKTPLHWIPGQPFASHFLSQINLMLPAGEFWFCKLYNQALPLITDAKLRADVQAFIRQEAMHARAHEGAVANYLAAHGIATDDYTRYMNWLFQEGPFADNPFGITLPKRLQREWLVFRLGLVAAIEHSTCLIGKYMLRNHNWDAVGADPEVLDLFRWHCAEEIEHRCVAFDLYQHLGGRYAVRYLQKIVWTPLSLGHYMAGATVLMQQDPAFAKRKPSVWRPWAWHEWHRVAKAGFLPSPLWMLKEELRYLNPWYNPADEADTQEALDYLARSPAVARLAAATAPR